MHWCTPFDQYVTLYRCFQHFWKVCVHFYLKTLRNKCFKTLVWRKLKLLKYRNQVSQIFSACCSYTFSLLGITLLAEINLLWQTFTHSYTQTWCPHAVVLHYLVTSFFFFFFFYTCTLQFRIAECCPLVRLSHFWCTRPAAFIMHQFILKEKS